MEDKFSCSCAETSPASRFLIALCRQSRSILQTHSGIGQETDLTALYLEPFHDCIAECLPSLLLKRKYSRSIY
ncbi:hypothetical protein ACOSQ3_009282 [Xanthoceras sorbifolium]